MTERLTIWQRFVRRFSGAERKDYSVPVRLIDPFWQWPSDFTTPRPLYPCEYRAHEIVYACIRLIAEAATDPTVIVERRARDGSAMRDDSHPLRRLLMRPNPQMDGAQLMRYWMTSLHTYGAFYAQIIRSRAQVPVELWPIPPESVRAVRDVSGRAIVSYEVVTSGQSRTLAPAEVLVHRWEQPDGELLSPLQVAINSIEQDTAQTDYVRNFFENGGVPSGVIKVTGTLNEERARALQERWRLTYGRGGTNARGVAVLDANAEYQRIGSALNELQSTELRELVETRICAAFGVPPILVGAYVGLVHVNQRASVREAQQHFWQNTMSPLLKQVRAVLQHQLLPAFEPLPLVESEQVRVNWDLSQVAALQEDVESIQRRAREAVRAGIMSVNEARAVLGLPPLPEGDVLYPPAKTSSAPASFAQDEQTTTLAESVQ